VKFSTKLNKDILRYLFEVPTTHSQSQIETYEKNLKIIFQQLHFLYALKFIMIKISLSQYYTYVRLETSGDLL
jgi:hypothetical protein